MTMEKAAAPKAIRRKLLMAKNKDMLLCMCYTDKYFMEEGPTSTSLLYYHDLYLLIYLWFRGQQNLQKKPEIV